MPEFGEEEDWGAEGERKGKEAKSYGKAHEGTILSLGKKKSYNQ